MKFKRDATSPPSSGEYKMKITGKLVRRITYKLVEIVRVF